MMKKEEIIAKINNMSREKMERLWMFGPALHIYFSGPYWEIFKKRFFDELGGFSQKKQEKKEKHDQPRI